MNYNFENFEKCVDRKEGDGEYEICCKMQFWLVSGPDKEWVEREAFHYWRQYDEDGEYDKILGRK